MLNEICEKVVVISLKRRLDRRERIAAHLEQLGIRFSFFDAIEPKLTDIRLAQVIGFDAYGGNYRLLTNEKYCVGNVGACLSHRAVLRAARALGMESIGILEDDCVFDDGWEGVVRSAYENLPSDWWQLNLAAHYIQPGIPVAPALMKLQEAWNAVASIYHHRAYDPIIESYESCSAENDVHLGRVIHPLGHSYATAPGVVHPDQSESDISSA